MRICAMNDCEWMAGETLESCIEEYLAEYAGGVSRDEALDDPYELSDEDMDRLVFCDEDGEKRSFRAQLERMVADGVKFPAYFATTEC